MECLHCKALVWYKEKTGDDDKTGAPLFSIYCQQGRVKLPVVKKPPSYLENLLDNNLRFCVNIRVYNVILAFTSMGAQIDDTVQSGDGPPTFRIHGQVFHRIGSLLPMPGEEPKYMQMYIVYGDNEVPNRVKMMSRKAGSELDEDVVAALINMLDEHNSLCKFFRKARDRFKEENIQELTIRFLDSTDKGQLYGLPASKEVAGLIVGDLTCQNYERDIVVQLQSDQLQRIRDDHPLLMSLQYPLLFPYGEYGFHTEITHAVMQIGERKRTFISIREYYAYQIQTRLNVLKCFVVSVLNKKNRVRTMVVT